MNTVTLQPLLLPGKENSPFSVHISPDKSTLHVYFGLALLEKVKNGQEGFQYKYLLARLYNAGFKRKNLKETFGHASSTLRRWGNAVKTGDENLMIEVFSGQGAKKVVTVEIENFVRSEFKRIYPENKYRYNSTIKARIKEVFNIQISSESLRKIVTNEKPEIEDKTENGEEVLAPINEANSWECCDNLSVKLDDNRNNSLPKMLEKEDFFGRLFLHHIGIIFAFFVLSDMDIVDQFIEQWIYGVLLGKVNMEQTESLDYDSLDFILSRQLVRTAKTQHVLLRHMAVENENRNNLLKLNADFFNNQEHSYYYYDPHSVKYTGMKNILKGWCGSAGKIAKINYQDFFHTSDGFPIYFEIHDNCVDMRERFIKSVDFFSREIIRSEGKTFIIDRGIYGREKMIKISKNGYGLVTWEKGYEHDGWNDKNKKISFKIVRPKNCSTDFKSWSIKFIKDSLFNKIPDFYRLIVRILPPGENKKEAEVSILTNGRIDDTTAVRAILNRWIQENDFRNLVINFGLNQITSYASEKYEDTKDILVESSVLSEGYKHMQNAIVTMKSKLGKELVKIASKTDDKTMSMNLAASAIKKEIDSLEEEMSRTQRYENKLQKLTRKNTDKLAIEKKAMLDAIKITARNIFYTLLGIFRPIYDNYRNDNKILRELICSHGYLSIEENQIKIQIDLERRLSPTQKRKIEHFISIIEGEINKRNIFKKRVAITLHNSILKKKTEAFNLRL